MIPCYLSSLLIRNNRAYSLHSQDFLYFPVPKVRTEMGKNSFRFAAPTTWNILQSELKLQSLVSLNAFKGMINPIISKLLECKCFN